MAFFISPPIQTNFEIYGTFAEIINTCPDDYKCNEKVVNFFESTIPNFSDGQFRTFFRLTPSTLEYLLLEIAPFWNYKKGVSLEKSCIIFLRFLGHLDSLESIALLFNLSKGCIWKVIRNIFGVLNASNFHIKQIHLPSYTEKCASAEKFSVMSKQKIDACIGAIDCREIPIQKPTQDHEAYFNRKCFHSIKLQAVVNHKKEFIDTFIGWPGRSNDARAFIHSPFYKFCNSGSLGRFYILGDSAYPKKDYLMTPFKFSLNLTTEQKLINKRISQCRQVVECAFGIQSARWRRTKNISCYSIEDCCEIVQAACSLHNLCSQKNEENFLDD